MFARFSTLALPALYIGVAALIQITQSNPFFWLLGMALFVVGASLWLSRTRLQADQRPLRKRGLNDRFYEVAPFIYLLAGITCLRFGLMFDQGHLPAMTLAAGTLYLVAGIGSGLMRAYHRRPAYQTN